MNTARATFFRLGPVLLLALITGLGVWPRTATADPCKQDGEECRRSQSCCGTSGNNGLCAKESGARFGVCCTPTGAEVCDAADNDCDGLVDEGFGLGVACDGVGECGAGTVECAGPSATRCSTDPEGSQDQSEAETCDGLDNDCDGMVDDGGDALCEDDNVCTTDVCNGAAGCTNTQICLGRVVPTGTTCDGYVDHVIDGTADDPSDDDGFADGGFNYTVAAGVISNVSDPGAAFYFTTFTAPAGASFVVGVEQAAVGLGGPEMDLTTLQVSEVVGTAPNATCITLIGTLDFPDSTDPSVTLSGFAGKELVLRWRIDPLSIVGEADPGVTFTLNFKTLVAGGEVDRDPDGVLVIRVLL